MGKRAAARRRAKPSRRTAAIEPKASPRSNVVALAASLWRRLGAVDEQTAVWAAAAGAFAIAVAGTLLAVELNIWMDEAFTLATTGAGVTTAWQRAIGFEAQPPLYFVLEAGWRLLDESSTAFARLPSVLFAALAVAVSVAAAHRIAPRFPPALAALLIAGNPLFIWAAAELRVYALVLLVGAVLTALFFEAFLTPGQMRRAQVWYAVVALIGLYTQYYIGFVIAAHGLTLLLMRRRALRPFALLMAFVAAGFAPFVRAALVHVSESGAFVTSATPLGAIHEVANVVFAFVLPHDVRWTGAVKAGGFALGAALALGIAWYGRPRISADSQRAVIFQWLICGAMFMLIFGVSGIPLDPLRHLVVLAPATLIVVCIVLGALSRQQLRVTLCAIAVFGVFAAGDLYATYKPPLSKLGDWQRVAALLANSPDPATPIAVFPAEVALPLGEYFRAPLLPIPRPMPLRIDYVRATTLRSEADAARVLDPVRARSPRLWLVTTRECVRSGGAYNYNCRFLEAYLAAHYRLRRRATFSGSIVRLFERDSTAAALSPIVHPHAN